MFDKKVARELVLLNKSMYVSDLKALLTSSQEEIYSKQLLIDKDRITVVTESLAIELQ